MAKVYYYKPRNGPDTINICGPFTSFNAVLKKTVSIADESKYYST